MNSLPICLKCGRPKAPIGRDVAAAVADSYCHWAECDGYRNEPYPGSLWPGEEEESDALPDKP